MNASYCKVCNITRQIDNRNVNNLWIINCLHASRAKETRAIRLSSGAAACLATVAQPWHKAMLRLGRSNFSIFSINSSIPADRCSAVGPTFAQRVRGGPRSQSYSGEYLCLTAFLVRDLQKSKFGLISTLRFTHRMLALFKDRPTHIHSIGKYKNRASVRAAL
jgi:hypothetical protein